MAWCTPPLLNTTAKAALCAVALSPAPVLAEGQADAPRLTFANVLSVGTEGVQTDAPEEGGAQIGAVSIRGNEAISDDQYQTVVEGFFGEPLTPEVLERLTDELAQLARDEGYRYTRAHVDEAAAALGIVAIAIDEGRIDDVVIEGAPNAQASSMLASLIGRPLKQQELESVLLRVSDIPGVSLRNAKLRRDNGQSVLVVKLNKSSAEARISADNYGTETFGPIRMRASGQLNGVMTSSDEMRASVRVNPIELDELLFFSGSYQTQVTDSGITARLAGSIGRTAPGGELEGSDVAGDSLRASAQVTVPVKRSKNASVWIDTRAAYISIEQEDLGTLLRDDTLVTAAVGLRTRFALAGKGYVRAGVSVERGLGILGATRLGDLGASRADGDGVYTKYSFNADMRLPIAKRFDAYLAVAGQLADRPLLGSEEIALGGAYRVRGYDFAEVLGDEGVYGLAELRYRVNTGGLPLDFLQLYAFADGGYVSDIDQTGGEGSLFSAGPGMRGRIGALDWEVESAFPLGGSGERSDPDGPQINVRTGVRF